MSPKQIDWQALLVDGYEPLRKALGAVAEVLVAAGWRARVLADDNALVDREAAYRAGLGWYGKNANILLPGQGSWFVLGAVVTDAPLPPATKPVDDGCGSCSRCVSACPTGAIVAQVTPGSPAALHSCSRAASPSRAQRASTACSRNIAQGG